MKQTKTLKYGFAILLSLAGVAGSMQTVNGQAKSDSKVAQPRSNQGVVIHLRSMSRALVVKKKRQSRFGSVHSGTN